MGSPFVDKEIRKEVAVELHKDSQVVQNLYRKRDLLLRGDKAHEEIRTVLVVCGGMMRGVYGAGAVAALHRLGLADSFDVVVGISTGACVAGYFLAGEEQTILGTSLYYGEVARHFSGFLRWPIVDIDYVEQLLRHSSKKLDTAAVLNHRSQFFVGVTDWESGEGCFLDVKRARPDALTAIKASFAMVEIYRRPVVVNENKFTDVSTAMQFPARKVLQKFEATDMLVIANRSRASAYSQLSWARRAFAFLGTVVFAPRAYVLTTDRTDLWMENMEYLRESKVNVGILWGPDSIGSLTRNSSRIKAAAEEGFRNTLTAFGQPKESAKLLLP